MAGKGSREVGKVQGLRYLLSRSPPFGCELVRPHPLAEAVGIILRYAPCYCLVNGSGQLCLPTGPNCALGLSECTVLICLCVISAHQRITLHPTHGLVIHLFIIAQTTGLWKIKILPKLAKFLLQYTSSGQTITFFPGLKGNTAADILQQAEKSLCNVPFLCILLLYTALLFWIFLNLWHGFQMAALFNFPCFKSLT